MKISLKWKILGSIRKLMLWIINRWLGGSNSGPIYYGVVNGLEAVSYESLRSEVRQQPDITVRELVESIDRFNSCSIGKTGLTVIEGDTIRDADVWDIHELNTTLSRREKDHV